LLSKLYKGHSLQHKSEPTETVAGVKKKATKKSNKNKNKKQDISPFLLLLPLNTLAVET